MKSVLIKTLVQIILLPALQLVPAASQAQSSLPRPDHIIIVIEENHGFTEIIGSNDAPFMNQLVQQGALLTQFYALHHPSQPNYIELFSGSNQGVTGDTCPSSLFSAPSLGGSLLAKSLTFMGYAENLPTVGSTVCFQPPYARKHCPWTDFSDVLAKLSVPFTQFPTDFTQLPTVSLVIPNLEHDMHDGTIQQADAWLKQYLDPYIQWAQSNNSLFILTWDEDNLHSPSNTTPPQNWIPTLLVGAMVTPGSVSHTVYDHHDLLRTIEDMYGLPRIGASQQASDITGIWKTTAPQAKP